MSGASVTTTACERYEDDDGRAEAMLHHCKPRIWRNAVTIPWAIVIFFFALVIATLPSTPTVARFLALVVVAMLLFTVSFVLRLLVLRHQTILKRSGSYWRRSVCDTLHTYFDCRVHGWRDYEGHGVIFTINHFPYGFLDCIALPLMHQRRTKIVTTAPGIYRPILERMGMIYVKHGGGFAAFMEQCLPELRRGTNLVVFPEGKYSDVKPTWHHLLYFQTGAFELAKRSGASIVPVLLDGRSEYRGMMRPGPLHVHFLKPIRPSRFETPVKLREHVRHVMNRHLARMVDFSCDDS